jgi:hypothetical protein
MRLLFAIVLIVSIFLSLTMIFFQSTRKTYPGFGRWTAGTCSMAAGFLFLSLRMVIPDFISIIAVAIALPLGQILFLSGAKRFLQESSLSVYWYGIVVASVIGHSYFTLIVDSAVWRSILVSAAVSIPNIVMSVLVYKHSRNGQSSFFLVISIVMIMSVVFIIFRITGILLTPAYDLLSDSPVQMIYFVSVILMQIALTISFIMLNSERLERELYEADSALKKTVEDLQIALVEVKALGGLLPICANCKKIRDDGGYWHQLEAYISTHSEAEFSHGTCPECARKLYPELFEREV